MHKIKRVALPKIEQQQKGHMQKKKYISEMPSLIKAFSFYELNMSLPPPRKTKCTY